MSLSATNLALNKTLMNSYMDREEFQKTRDYFEKKALELMRHEEKNLASVGVPINNYLGFEINGRNFYAVQTNGFMHIFKRYLLQAQDQTPEKFGTGEALDVVEAIRLLDNFWGFDVNRFSEFLIDEQFAHVFESENGEIVDRMLRLDLYRETRPNDKEQQEFVGGLFHALKHFSRKGINYSTGKDIHDIPHPTVLIREIIDAFFCSEGTFKSKAV